MSDTTTLVSRVMMDLRPGDTLALDAAGSEIRLEMVAKSGRAARFRIVSPRCVGIEKRVREDSDTKHAKMPATVGG